MKDRLTNECDTILNEMNSRCPSLENVLSNDHVLGEKIKVFEDGLSNENKARFQELAKELNLMRKNARLVALHAARANDDQLGEHVQHVRKISNESKDYDKAVVAIQREAHLHEGGIGNIVKSLFMWKATPEQYFDEEV